MIAIVLSFDRFPLRMLGCYGNNGIETPNFDLLAAQSAVFDQAYSADVDDPTGNWLRGCFQFPRSPEFHQQQPALLDLLHERGVATRLIRESAAEAMPEGSGFQHVTEVGDSTDRDTPPEATPFARLIQRACEELGELEQDGASDSLLWLHGRGLAIPPLPPIGLASLYFDLLEAVEPVPSLDPRRGTILIDGADDLADDEPDEESAQSADAEPEDTPQHSDEEIAAILDRLEQTAGNRSSWERQDWRVLRLVTAGAASLIDAWLGKLLHSLASISRDREVVLIITAGRGAELDHQADLPDDSATNPENGAPLRESEVHVPLMIHHSASGVGSRYRQLVQSVDIPPTLAEWFGIESPTSPFEGRSLRPVTLNEQDTCRDTVIAGDRSGNRYVRTAALSLQIPAGDRSTGTSELTAESLSRVGRLFVKPDDRWDLQDVSAQSPDDVAALARRLLSFEEATARSAVTPP